jgi:hypothetical protein
MGSQEARVDVELTEDMMMAKRCTGMMFGSILSTTVQGV